MIFMGALIIAVPKILVAFVAAFVFLSGLGLLYAGHKMKKFQSNWQDILRSEAQFRVYNFPQEEQYAYWH